MMAHCVLKTMVYLFEMVLYSITQISCGTTFLAALEILMEMSLFRIIFIMTFNKLYMLTVHAVMT